MQKTLFIFLACLLWAGKAHAQKEANVWYFGDGYGIEFQKGKVIEHNNSKMNAGTLRGNITLCDSAGKLRFYSDGISVWNSKHQLIAKDLHGEINISAVPHTSRQDVYLLFYTGRQEKTESYLLGNEKKVQTLERQYLGEVEKTQKANAHVGNWTDKRQSPLAQASSLVPKYLKPLASAVGEQPNLKPHPKTSQKAF